MRSDLEMNATNERAAAAILVVEDEPIVRMIVVDHLNESGFTTVESQDAREALAHLEAGARFDLMLTDVGLPGMNGRDLARAARRLAPGLRVLFATGYSESDSAALGLPAEGMDVVGKPFDLDELVRRIEALMRG